mgnify:CR=1 FL=1
MFAWGVAPLEARYSILSVIMSSRASSRLRSAILRQSGAFVSWASLPTSHLSAIYIIFVGKNIELSIYALQEIVKSIEGSDANLLYSDHDYKIDGKRKNPCFKPDFAIDTLLSRNYIGNFIVIKNRFLKYHPELIENIGDELYYDLVLRISEKTKDIHHISRILFHNIKDDIAYLANTLGYDIEFYDKKEALKDVNLKVPRGKIIGLLGKNGSGKSTLFKLANDLLTISSGEILVDGMSTLAEETELLIKRKVGMVFQNPDNQFIASTVEEDIAFGLENKLTPNVSFISVMAMLFNF